MAFNPAPVRDPFDKDLRASRSWVAWFAEVQQEITKIVAGSVTSVGLSLPSQFTVTGSPVTGAGTLAGAWKNQSANAFLGGPATGASAAPDFRALTTADIPALAYDPTGSAATVQTNLNTHTGLTGTSVHGLGNWSVVNYPTWASGTPFLKMTAAGTFALDTSTYLTSLSGAVLTDQTAGQTIGATGTRLTKLWATDITVTNAITGSVTGNAGTVTNGLYTTGLGSVTQAYSAKLAGLAGLTDAAGWYHSNGSGTYTWSTPTAADVAAVPYTGASGNVDLGAHSFTVDTTTLFVDGVNHRIGIGTASPALFLDIQKNGNASATAGLTNTDAGSSSLARWYMGSDVASLSLFVHATGRVATRYGVTVGGWDELFANAGNGLLIGTSTNATPIVFGTNGVEVVRMFASSGVAIGTTTDPGATNLSVAGNVKTATGYVMGTSVGIDATITTSGLVGKTLTVSKGIITGFA